MEVSWVIGVPPVLIYFRLVFPLTIRWGYPIYGTPCMYYGLCIPAGLLCFTVLASMRIAVEATIGTGFFDQRIQRIKKPAKKQPQSCVTSIFSGQTSLAKFQLQLHHNYWGLISLVLPSGNDIQKAIENGPVEIVDLSHWKWWFSIVFCMFTRG